MAVTPQLSRGPDDAYTLYLDFGAVSGTGFYDESAVRQAFAGAWWVVGQLRLGDRFLVRLTTIDPTDAGPWHPMGLRPGEYAAVRMVKSLPWRFNSWGVPLQKADRNPSLYTPTLAIAVAPEGNPRRAGLNAGHEFGHLILPSWPDDYSGHDADPSNVMHGTVSNWPSWTTRQIRLVAENVERVRVRGERITGPVQDGGRPAWPLEARP